MRDTGGSDTARTGKGDHLILHKIVWAVARALVPADRPDVLSDIEELNHDEPYPLLWAGLGLRWAQLERSVYPSMVIRYDAPPPEEARRRMIKNFKRLRRTLKLFIVGAGILTWPNSHILPDVAHMQVFYAAAPGQAMWFFLVSYRLTAWWAKYIRPKSDADVAWLSEVRRMQSFLLAAPFDPVRFAIRSWSLSLAAMFLFFPPVYIVLRRLGGDAIPYEAGWDGILLRLLAALILTWMFAVILEDNRIAARVFQEEIDAIKRGRFEPVTA
jgi:hypothetical protein